MIMNSRTIFRSLSILLLWGLAACSAQPTPTPALPAAPTPTAVQYHDTPGTFAPNACRFVLPEDLKDGQNVECGTLALLEDRHKPEGHTIRLAVAVFHRPGGAIYPDPVIYLSGGPGVSALKGMQFNYEEMTGAVFAAGRDLVVFDQRGIGISRPALDCPNYNTLFRDLLDQQVNGRVVDSQRVPELILSSLQECRDTLSQSADLTHYNSAESADDVEELRQALGYAQVNLWGGSYGTRLGLEVMRRHPEHLRSVALEAVYPPDVDLFTAVPGNFSRSLELLFESCAANAVCSAAYPDLESVLFDTVERLNADPVPRQITDPFTGEEYDTFLDGGALLNLIFQVLYDSKLRYLLPEMIYDASQGNFTTLDHVREALLAMMSLTSRGLLFSVQCHEEVAFSSPQAFQAALGRMPQISSMYANNQQGTLIFSICQMWEAGQAAPSANQPVTSSLPTLVLNGEFDPITPPAWGEHAAQTLSNAYVFTYPGIGHGATFVDNCPRSMFTAFLLDPSTSPDDACIAAMKR